MWLEAEDVVVVFISSVSTVHVRVCCAASHLSQEDLRGLEQHGQDLDVLFVQCHDAAVHLLEGQQVVEDVHGGGAAGLDVLHCLESLDVSRVRASPKTTDRDGGTQSSQEEVRESKSRSATDVRLYHPSQQHAIRSTHLKSYSSICMPAIAAFSGVRSSWLMYLT